jgi:hypothetical protein
MHAHAADYHHNEEAANGGTINLMGTYGVEQPVLAVCMPMAVYVQQKVRCLIKHICRFIYVRQDDCNKQMADL